jgi:hypothetical protein
VEPILAFTERLKDDGEFREDIKEAAAERFGEEYGDIIDLAIELDPEAVPNPFREDLEAALRDRDEARTERDRILSEVEANTLIHAEMNDLRSAHGLSEEKAHEVLEFAAGKFEETGQALSLEDAWKLMDYENQAKRAAGAKRPRVPGTPAGGPGAKNIKSRPSGSFEDIKVDGYDLFE